MDADASGGDETDLDGEEHDPGEKQRPMNRDAGRERSVCQSRVDGDAESADYRSEHGDG